MRENVGHGGWLGRDGGKFQIQEAPCMLPLKAYEGLTFAHQKPPKRDMGFAAMVAGYEERETRSAIVAGYEERKKESLTSFYLFNYFNIGWLNRF